MPIAGQFVIQIVVILPCQNIKYELPPQLFACQRPHRIAKELVKAPVSSIDIKRPRCNVNAKRLPDWRQILDGRIGRNRNLHLQNLLLCDSVVHRLMIYHAKHFLAVRRCIIITVGAVHFIQRNKKLQHPLLRQTLVHCYTVKINLRKQHHLSPCSVHRILHVWLPVGQTAKFAVK